MARARGRKRSRLTSRPWKPAQKRALVLSGTLCTCHSCTHACTTPCAPAQQLALAARAVRRGVQAWDLEGQPALVPYSALHAVADQCISAPHELPSCTRHLAVELLPPGAVLILQALRRQPQAWHALPGLVCAGQDSPPAAAIIRHPWWHVKRHVLVRDSPSQALRASPDLRWPLLAAAATCLAGQGHVHVNAGRAHYRVAAGVSVGWQYSAECTCCQGWGACLSSQLDHAARLRMVNPAVVHARRYHTSFTPHDARHNVAAGSSMMCT